MRIFPLRLLGFLVFAFPTFLRAAAGTEGASFLEIPVGAAPAAMGSAYTALATNAYGVVWNPAGLAFLSHSEIAAQHLSFLEGIHDEFASIAVPLNEFSTLGIAAQYLGSGDIAGRGPTGAPIGDFSAHYAAYSIAYGYRLLPGWSVGVASKLIDAILSDISAQAIAFDVGVHGQLTDRLDVAATVVNMGNKLRFLNEGDSLPLAFHISGAYQPTSAMTVATEGVFSKTGAAHGRLGLEWRPMNAVSLRTGYRSDTVRQLSALAGFSTGVGLHVWDMEFAYAWVPYADLGTTHYFSIRLPLKLK